MSVEHGELYVMTVLEWKRPTLPAEDWVIPMLYLCPTVVTLITIMAIMTVIHITVERVTKDNIHP